MLKFRSKIGSLFALLALAVQIALSFGHVHGTRSAPVSVLAVDVSLAVLPAALPDPGVPVKPTGLASDACALCALTSLTGPPAAPPALSPPAVRGQTQLFASVERPLVAGLYFLFQARAPPLA